MNLPVAPFESIDLRSIQSPGLIVDVQTVHRNVDRMIEIVGGHDQVGRLRPHVKTHKMPQMVRLQTDAGIHRFKAATIAEAEMIATVGAFDVLLAYPVVGPNVDRWTGLIQSYPATKFACVVDSIDGLALLMNSPVTLDVFIDVDCGMHRTGIAIGDGLDKLRGAIESNRRFRFAGLHVYDGHVHQTLLDQRTAAVTEILTSLKTYVDRSPVPTIVVGGSPTFAIWANQTDYQCSPGTPLLWDVGYEESFADLGFEIAAALVTRVVSKPGGRRVCVDLGHKAVAAEMELSGRVVFAEVPDAKLVSQSEEHLVLETDRAASLSIGQPLIAFPRHICPTVALHAFAHVVDSQSSTALHWPVVARDR